MIAKQTTEKKIGHSLLIKEYLTRMAIEIKTPDTDKLITHGRIVKGEMKANFWMSSKFWK